jgi:hypothetical protein
MSTEGPSSNIDRWEPAWEFMNDPELKRLTIMLDESFSGLKSQEEVSPLCKFQERSRRDDAKYTNSAAYSATTHYPFHTKKFECT